MRMKAAAAVIAIFSLTIGVASAATTTGRITYIAPDRELMLDNSDMYAVSPAVDLSSVAVADRVRIDWTKRNGKDVITSLVKAPLDAAAAG